MFLSRRGLLACLPALPLMLPALKQAMGVAAQQGPVSRRNSTSLRTPDFDETLRWYQDKLGFRLISSQSFVAGRSAVLERDGFLLEVSEADHFLPQSQETATTAGLPVTRLPVISITVPDVDEEIARLGAMGVEILAFPEDDLEGVYRSAQIRDNGRHRIELREPLGSQASFHAQGR